MSFYCQVCDSLNCFRKIERGRTMDIYHSRIVAYDQRLIIFIREKEKQIKEFRKFARSLEGRISKMRRR